MVSQMTIPSAGCIGHDAGIAGRMTELPLDDRDRRLLDLLRRDARMSIVALARELNLSRSATQERLAKLRSSGIIDGFTIREGKRSGARQSAYVMVSFEGGYRCAQIVPKLERLSSIGMIHSVTGPIDLVIRIDAEDIAGIESSRSAIAAIEGVASVSTSVVLDRHRG
jgi:DNA-binding Lrp family transcriptional regulator